METLLRIPLDNKTVSNYLEFEKDFLKGLLQQFEEINEESLKGDKASIVAVLKQQLPELVEKSFPSKDLSSQVKVLQQIVRILTKTFNKWTLKDFGLNTRWISLDNGYLGRIVEENYEIAILLYLIAVIYQAKSLSYVQTSTEYRYCHISALSALYSAIEFLEKINPSKEGHYANPFYQVLQLRKLEFEAEITKSEAFLARKQGDFERAAKLFAGSASYRFSMMNFELSEETDNRMKILASTELGMACFYIAVGLQNTNELTQAHLYLLKAKNYFENAAKLSEGNTELLEAANKRLDLVNPYIDRIKDSIDEEAIPELESIPDPQPLMTHVDPESLISTKDNPNAIAMICSNCYAKIEWSEDCPICKERILFLK